MLSVLMAALMVVSIMPVTGSNNIVAKASTASAESSVVTWSAADILADTRRRLRISVMWLRLG